MFKQVFSAGAVWLPFGGEYENLKQEIMHVAYRLAQVNQLMCFQFNSTG